MRGLLLLLLASCDLEPASILAHGWPACEEPPFAEAVLHESPSLTLVAATRASCLGFPDAATDYRIYRVDDGRRTLVLEGTMETKHWTPRISRDGDGSVVIELAIERCRITGDLGRCELAP